MADQRGPGGRKQTVSRTKFNGTRLQQRTPVAKASTQRSTIGTPHGLDIPDSGHRAAGAVRI